MIDSMRLALIEDDERIGEFVEKGLALHPKLDPKIMTIQDSDGVGHDVRFLHDPPHLTKIVTRGVVLAITDY